MAMPDTSEGAAMDKERLLHRLDEIGQSLAESGHGRALIGLGSVGVELERLDDYSDLDFFAIVEVGYKQKFLQDLTWLSRVHPIAYSFQNTPDGYKLLYSDGIFCEMAIFEEAELEQIPFAEGRIVWKAEEVDEAIRLPRQRTRAPAERPVEWLVGEALTCLYVGLQRHLRGEKLSAQRFVQHFAVDRVVELIERHGEHGKALVDPFAVERRIEARHPDLAPRLATFIQGYEGTPASARALLAFLDEHFVINHAMRDHILALYEQT
jgi:hypothetical protein